MKTKHGAATGPPDRTVPSEYPTWTPPPSSAISLFILVLMSIADSYEYECAEITNILGI